MAISEMSHFGNESQRKWVNLTICQFGKTVTSETSHFQKLITSKLCLLRVKKNKNSWFGLVLIFPDLLSYFEIRKVFLSNKLSPEISAQTQLLISFFACAKFEIFRLNLSFWMKLWGVCISSKKKLKSTCNFLSLGQIICDVICCVENRRKTLWL